MRWDKAERAGEGWLLMLVVLGLLVFRVTLEIRQGVSTEKFVVLVGITAFVTVCVAMLGYHWWPQTEDWP